jgi:hypothetical protein
MFARAVMIDAKLDCGSPGALVHHAMVRVCHSEGSAAGTRSLGSPTIVREDP